MWLGRCQSGLGRFEDARESYRRAIALSEAGAEETGAPELLAELDALMPAGEGPPRQEGG